MKKTHGLSVEFGAILPHFAPQIQTSCLVSFSGENPKTNEHVSVLLLLISLRVENEKKKRFQTVVFNSSTTFNHVLCLNIHEIVQN